MGSIGTLFGVPLPEAGEESNVYEGGAIDRPDMGASGARLGRFCAKSWVR